MGYIYERSGILYAGFTGVDGKEKQLSTRLPVGKEDKARQVLRRMEERVAAARAAGEDANLGPLTVRQWSKKWIASRKAKGISNLAGYQGQLDKHILPRLGAMRLDAVRRQHIVDMVAELQRLRPALAPRTVRAIYFTAHAMFRKAIGAGLIDINPCSIDTDDLPAKVDKDREWRHTAIYTRGEITTIISNAALPDDRRTFYALMALGGLRFGEASALRWRHYDAEAEPLGSLAVVGAYSTHHLKEKSVKEEEKPRRVPVHPTLARILAEWKLGGFAALMGHKPKADDLIVPSREGRNRNANHMLKRFHEDLDRLGLRKRRQHDLRRTFISLALSDGARKDILRWVTHGPTGDIMDLYTTLPWTALCGEVAKLAISLPKGEVIALRKAAGSRGVNLQSTYSDQKSAFSSGKTMRGGRDLNPRPPP